MIIEKTDIWITCERPLEGDGRAMRGFLGNVYRDRPEFYGHKTGNYRSSTSIILPTSIILRISLLLAGKAILCKIMEVEPP